MTGAVSTRRVPGDLGHPVVLRGSEKLNVESPLSIGLLGDLLVGGEVEVPELDIALGGLEGSENDLSTSRRPEDSVGGFVVEGLCEGRGREGGEEEVSFVPSFDERERMGRAY